MTAERGRGEATTLYWVRQSVRPRSVRERESVCVCERERGRKRAKTR